MILLAWTFILIVHPHLFAVPYEAGEMVLPTWELCEATRRAVESLASARTTPTSSIGRPENSS